MHPATMLSTLVLLAFMSWTSPALAHGGEDHGTPTAEMPASNQPRAIAASEDYEVVAVLKGGALLIFLDRFADNSPVTEAKLTVTVGSTELHPELTKDGVYRLQSNLFAQHGKHDLIFAIEDGSKSDLLITSIDIPAHAAVAAPGARDSNSTVDSFVSALSSAVARLKTVLSTASPTQISIGVGILIGVPLLLSVLRRRRRAETVATAEAVNSNSNAAEAEGTRDGSSGKAATYQTRVTQLRSRPGDPAAAAALLLLFGAAVLPAPKAIAHGGEDHGEANQPVVSQGDAPRRLPDASVYLPKPTQRLLEVRTLQTQETKTQPRQSLVGRVIADPDRFGVVQSTLGGRITPPKSGLPKLGQAVKAGDVLGYVAPYIAAIDRSDAAQTAGNLEQEIALAESRLVRAKRLFAVNAGTRVQVEEREIELEGLKKRRTAIAGTTTKPEALVAPIDGVIAAVKVVAGQVVEVKDVLFEIIDPSSLWVEAFVFDQSVPQVFSDTTAAAQDGASFKLSYIGRSRALRQQSTILQFAIENPPQSLNIGMPVTVLVQQGDPVNGIVLPKTAVVRGSNGEDVVWQHAGPERFVAAPVKLSSFDGERVLVLRGLEAGQRVVVQGAELINQVR